MKALEGNLVWVLAVAALAGLVPACGQLPPGRGTKEDVWKDAWGTAETQPFRLVDGRSSPESSVEALSRADWVVDQEGRTYLLYETDPENRDSNEGLWIGLLGDNREIQRKILLARDVREISGVQGGETGEAYVEATDAEGERVRIPLRYPEPWPEIGTEGTEWERHTARQRQLEQRLWEDWPDSGSGYATEHVEVLREDALEAACGRAVERLREADIPETLREDLAAEPGRTVELVREVVGDSSKTALSQHWANVEDAGARQEYLEAYLQNWLEGAEHPDGWARVCGARGEFRGEPFRATNGMVAVALRPGQAWTGDELPRWALVRLAPERVHEEDGRTLVGFDLVLPEKLYLVQASGSGTFEADADGVLRVKEMETSGDIPWTDWPEKAGDADAGMQED